MGDRDPDAEGRFARQRTASVILSSLDDDALTALLAGATPATAGIGGETAMISVAGVPVFVKRIPLTTPEIAAGVKKSENVFDLPVVCHYGIGSPGFGAQREVRAIEITSGWVERGTTHSFPLLYHWRELPGAPVAVADELRDVGGAMNYWNGSLAVRDRIEALASAPASVWVFLEFFPSTLDAWLHSQWQLGSTRLDDACRMVDREFTAALATMTTEGFVHMDAHFDNILTDGRRLFLGDLGLAMSHDLTMTYDEVAFLDAHRSFDRSYVYTFLVRWLLRNPGGVRRVDEEDAIAAAMAGVTNPRLSPSAQQIIHRYAPVAAAVMPFYRDLQTVSRSTPYPADLEAAAWARVGAPG